MWANRRYNSDLKSVFASQTAIVHGWYRNWNTFQNKSLLSKKKQHLLRTPSVGVACSGNWVNPSISYNSTTKPRHSATTNPLEDLPDSSTLSIKEPPLGQDVPCTYVINWVTFTRASRSWTRAQLLANDLLRSCQSKQITVRTESGDEVCPLVPSTIPFHFPTSDSLLEGRRALMGQAKLYQRNLCERNRRDLRKTKRRKRNTMCGWRIPTSGAVSFRRINSSNRNFQISDSTAITEPWNSR